MTKLLVCIDGSAYADNICENAAWMAKRMDAEVDLLHVLRRNSEYKAPDDDHTGAIGLGARSNLLEELTKVDSARARLDQEKGEIILRHGEQILKAAGVKQVNRIHRRGSLTETVQELEDGADMIFIGKRGEHADTSSVFLGANLEKTARSIHKPLFVVSSVVRPIGKFLIAYDGKESIEKAIEYLEGNPVMNGLAGYLLTVGDVSKERSQNAEKRLTGAGLNIQSVHVDGQQADDAISAFVKDQQIDLLITGAYSHSRVRSILLGSTTADLIKRCHIPMILFR